MTAPADVSPRRTVTEEVFFLFVCSGENRRNQSVVSVRSRSIYLKLTYGFCSSGLLELLRLAPALSHRAEVSVGDSPNFGRWILVFAARRFCVLWFSLPEF